MANLDITVARGADWVHVATIKDNGGTPVTVAAANFVGEVKNPNATVDTVAATFTFALVTDGTDGKIRITLTAAQSLLLRKDRLYAYDIFATLLSRRYRMLWGNVELQPNTTTL